jgi:hypothetical protein
MGRAPRLSENEAPSTRLADPSTRDIGTRPRGRASFRRLRQHTRRPAAVAPGRPRRSPTGALEHKAGPWLFRAREVQWRSMRGC